MASKTISNLALIGAIFKKDCLQFSRDKLYFIMSIAGLILFTAFFWFTPDSVNEMAVIGISYTNLGPFEEAFQNSDEEGMSLLIFPDEKSLQKVIRKDAEAWIDTAGNLFIVDAGDKATRPEKGKRQSVNLGLNFPADFLSKTLQRQEAAVQIYTNNETPAELEHAMQSLVRELVFLLTANELPVTQGDESTMVLGTDRLGAQIAMRDRMRPILIFFILMMEVFALASLIATEILHKTVTAITASPAKAFHILVSKLLFGSMLAFTQGVIILAATGSFSAGNPLIMLIATMTGALMFSGIAMFVGSMGKDFIGTLAFTMLFVIPFAIPAFSIMFPGSTPLWIRFVPSYGVMEMFNATAIYGQSWNAIVQPLIIAIVWLVIILGSGLWVLKRKVVTL